jgi:pimeloyl-ACP methyl ester carboxylesterase
MSYIAPPLPGHYPAVFPQGYQYEDLTSQNLADLLAQVIQEMVGDREVILYGISLGAFTALTLAALSSLRVRGLVAISGFARGALSGIKGYGQELARRDSALVRSFFKFSHRVQLSRWMIRWVMRFTCNPARVYRFPHLDELVEGVYRPLHYLDTEAMLIWYKALGDIDITSHLPRIDAKTLIVAGTADPIVPSAESVKIAQYIPGAELCLIEDVGHVPFLEAPDHFRQVFSDWSRRHILN